jgi:hypothetical protein
VLGASTSAGPGRAGAVGDGRILAELHETSAEVDGHVDAVVGENGAVLATPTGTRRLAPPVPEDLAAALTARDVICRTGLVLVACGGDVDHVVLDEVRRLGLDCQLFAIAVS